MSDSRSVPAAFDEVLVRKLRGEVKRCGSCVHFTDSGSKYIGLCKLDVDRSPKFGRYIGTSPLGIACGSYEYEMGKDRLK